MSKKTTKVAAAASAPFQAADHLRTDAEIAAYVESMLEDGDPRAVPVALRTVAEASRVQLARTQGRACGPGAGTDVQREPKR